MTKLRLTISFEMEYECEEDCYPEGSRTALGMLDHDIENAKKDPQAFLDMLNTKVSVSGEVVGEEK